MSRWPTTAAVSGKETAEELGKGASVSPEAAANGAGAAGSTPEAAAKGKETAGNTPDPAPKVGSHGQRFCGKQEEERCLGHTSRTTCGQHHAPLELHVGHYTDEPSAYTAVVNNTYILVSCTELLLAFCQLASLRLRSDILSLQHMYHW